VILLQVDPAFGNELEIIYEGFYKIEDILIFAWFSIHGFGHYRWLHNLCRNPTLGLSVRRQLTLPKVGKWSPPGFPKTQKTI
jgi:hypothetical protein